MRSRPTWSARFFRTALALAAIVPALLVTFSTTGIVWAQKQVTVVVDGRTARVSTHAVDVDGVLKQANVVVSDADVVTPLANTEVTDGMTVVVRHAIPVTVSFGEQRSEVSVVGVTVADALLAAGVHVAPDAEVTPPIDAPLVKGMSIVAARTYSRTKELEVVLPFKTEVYADSSLPRGTRQVLVEGKEGVALQRLESTVTDGVESEPAIASQKVLAKPVAQLEIVGPGVSTKDASGARLIPAKHGGKSGPSKTAQRMRLVSTAYSPNEPGGGGGPSTAMGRPAVFGVAAVDPDVIPLGSRLYVVGYGYAMAYDTGGAIKGNRIDLCFDTGEECERYGVKPVTVFVLE